MARPEEINDAVRDKKPFRRRKYVDCEWRSILTQIELNLSLEK